LLAEHPTPKPVAMIADALMDVSVVDLRARLSRVFAER
jgi:hypothetical protein